MAAKTDDAAYRHAYMVVVPNPNAPGQGANPGNFLAIKREAEGKEPKYVFWFKIGDTSEPEPQSRVNHYQINPDYRAAIVKFSDHEELKAKGGPHPGTQLKKDHFTEYFEQASIANSSEWFALYAKDDKTATDLRKRLSSLLDQFNPPDAKADELTKEMSFKKVDEMIRDFVQKIPSEDFGPPENPDPKPEAETKGEKHAWVEIMVTPSIHENAQNKGFVAASGSSEPAKDYGRYYVQITTLKRRIETMKDVARRHMTELPDFA
ncbi:hypothetical protein FRC08_000782 [Ceratobasidium sp. 394]|nr:hypothetical protein FRC08_000782 [Ceratobasidium sp. 394]